eukprot:CAMPEP_0194763806 /NCGR_PEP_ID=MMETSP0323_2-20130528/20564_1 /TAXON_ID=2866 ORGANISM="Crypthecodinium cohnii, Strain Seligo" /NCGR_SAMPLE_ID=MMETSP0323_2 /ASSEMBLY_ACC=CAM_ASM_000346 /LENGTH=90 /DNA_ID=CAMNT_0039689543 /DNA_START=21 /DNA_END=293 /DNA_ORIENTATION=-
MTARRSRSCMRQRFLVVIATLTIQLGQLGHFSSAADGPSTICAHMDGQAGLDNSPGAGQEQGDSAQNRQKAITLSKATQKKKRTSKLERI